MNQVDLLVIAVVLGSALAGARRGLISSAGDISSLIVGLGAGSLAYPLGAAPLKWIFGLSPTAAGALGFVLVAASAVFLTAWAAGHLAERYEPPRRIGRVGGAIFGGIMGLLLAAVLLLASGLLPGAGETVKASLLGPRIITMIPSLHESMDRIGLPLPKLVQLPTNYREELSGMRQGTQFLRVNFSRLDGAMCINCRTPTQFLGYRFSRGTMISPEYRCPKCGRTSDGCQTFEGFHTIYGQCPVDLAKEGVAFDCGVWTNGWWTVPHGKCPVCGKEFSPH